AGRGASLLRRQARRRRLLALDDGVLGSDEFGLRRLGELALQPPEARENHDSQYGTHDQGRDEKEESQHEHRQQQYPVDDALRQAAAAQVDVDDGHCPRLPQASEWMLLMMTPPDFSSCSRARSLRASASSSSFPKDRKP